MAGKLWMKAGAWKKTAVFLCMENTATVPRADFEIRSPFEKGYSSRSLSSLGREIQKSSFITDTLKPRNIVSRSSVGKSFFFPLTSSAGRHPNSVLKRTFNGSVRYFSTPSGSDSNVTKSADGDISKVGIISSMFKEEQEVENASKKQAIEKEEVKDESSQGGKEEKTENAFLRSQKYAKWMLLATFAFGTPLLVYEFGPPKRDHEGNIIPDEYSDQPWPIAYTKRTFGELTLMKKDIVEPSSQKLLPDPLQPPYYQPPYTLVLELFDVLLHPVHDQVHGWRFKKRPGIDYLLEHAGPPLYEIVIFTRENGMVAYPLIDSMDPKGYIMYRLFRDAARFKSGFKMGDITKGELPKLDPYYQKDLTYLNRDLKRVVVVDIDRRATELQPSNGISLKPWDGSNADTELFDLAAFLHTLATNEVDDVRPVLEHYRKYDDPLAAFKLAQSRMHEEQQKLMKEMQDNKGRSFLTSSKGGGFGMLTNFFRSKN